jgi:hypothetical protein
MIHWHIYGIKENRICSDDYFNSLYPGLNISDLYTKYNTCEEDIFILKNKYHKDDNKNITLHQPKDITEINIPLQNIQNIANNPIVKNLENNPILKSLEHNPIVKRLEQEAYLLYEKAIANCNITLNGDIEN